MPRPVDTPELTGVSAVLEALSGTAATAEDDLLSCLVVMGEPDAQAVVDGWVDQLVDLLRAVDEVTGHHRATLSRVTMRQLPHEAREAHAPVDTAQPADLW